MSLTVAALYRFAEIPEPAALADALRRLAAAAGLRGTLILAPEGVNGTLAGPAEGIAALRARLDAEPGLAPLSWRESRAGTQPFRRLKIRVKREIVTLGRPEVSPARRVGAYVPPEDWNAVLEDPGTVVIDTRNAYEVTIGRFAGARDPGTGCFRDFPAWWAAQSPALAGKRVAMYCTGGIRCEKASSYLLGQGVPEVLHLKGGILAYLQRVPEAQSLWRGECFVFDGRVAVGHGLARGTHSLCHACGWAVSPEDRAHPAYVPGVSCPACRTRYSEADRARFAERERQARLARARGRTHLAEG